MKKYVIIAGVNGAGKSTLYLTSPSLKNLERINTDEILREWGDWRNPTDVIKAGKLSLQKLSACFANNISINQETTLCGHSIIRNIESAKDKGYIIELHYVGVDSVEIAKDRVSKRVAMGGHGIPEKDIERRYYESFKNLNTIINKCDLIAFYDNTESFRRFAIYKNGIPVRISKKIPSWFERYISNN